MRVAHVSTFDGFGGAARAAHRLHAGLGSVGAESAMFVRTRTMDDASVHGMGSPLTTLRQVVEEAALRRWPRRRPGPFSLSPLPERVLHHVLGWRPDVVNLHWLGYGFVRPEGLRGAGRPLVWTLHDTAAFTGGCHYPGECRGYLGRCGRCPALGSSHPLDASRRVWQRKHRAWRDVGLAIVAPSRWLARCARESALFRDHRVEVIPNGVDLMTWRSVDREVARDLLHLPRDRRYVLFSAAGGDKNRIKGFDLLAAAMCVLRDTGRAAGVEVLVAGCSALSPAIDTGLRVRPLGALTDDIALVLANSAADVIAVPSREENFANTLVEALACGRPAVAFALGGNPDLVEDRVNGALAPPFDVRALADAVDWTLADEARWRRLADEARRSAERELNLELQARRYLALYEELVLTSSASARLPEPAGTHD
jgi:glycosyltransferase involved in cell wall biosynthesis